MRKTSCKHRWYYHDGARHCFQCRTTEEGEYTFPGKVRVDATADAPPKEVMPDDSGPRTDRSTDVNGAPKMEPPCPTCNKFENPVCSDIYHPKRQGHVYKDGVLQPSDAEQPIAWRWEETGSGDPIRLHSRKPIGNVLNLRALVYAHPEDAPGGHLERLVERWEHEAAELFVMMNQASASGEHEKARWGDEEVRLLRLHAAELSVALNSHQGRDRWVT